MKPVTYDAFASTVLKPWLEGEEQPTGLTFASPRDAAGRAAFEAAVTHAGKRGVVLVSCADGGLARSCGDFLRSFFSDQPQLAKLLKRTTPEGVELHGNTRIVVTTDSTRRPRDLLCAIKLNEASHRLAEEDIDPRQLAHVLCHIAADDPEARRGWMTELTGIDIEAAMERDRQAAEARAYEQHRRRLEMGGPVSNAPGAPSAAEHGRTSVPIVPRFPERDVTSPEFERQRMGSLGTYTSGMSG